MLSEEERALIETIDNEELIQLTRDLIRIDSVIRPETGNTESRVVEFLASWIRREIKVEPLIEEVEPGRSNIIVTIDSGKKGPVLMFEGHTDVVSEGDRSKWTYDPFEARVENGRIYGRGSCDMKAGVAVNLITVKSLLASGGLPGGKIRLGIVCDEEGMMIGIKDFIKRGHAKDVDACLVSEPEENQLCLSMKGAIRALIRVHGKMAHGAMPLTGINPNTRMARIILAFEEFESREKNRCGKDEYLGWPSVTFTVVQTPPVGEPYQLNVMPSRSIGYVDIRTVPKQDHDTLRKELQSILDTLSEGDKDFSAEIDYIEDRPVVYMEKSEPIVRAAASAYRDVTGKKEIYNGVPGATDGTFLRAWENIPCLVNGPGPRHIPHQIDEYVDIDELTEAARVYAVTAYRFLNSPDRQ